MNPEFTPEELMWLGDLLSAEREEAGAHPDYDHEGARRLAWKLGGSELP